MNKYCKCCGFHIKIERDWKGNIKEGDMYCPICGERMYIKGKGKKGKTYQRKRVNEWQ
jgi:uncharacterized Zn finger protein (UPF0148 family)